VPQGGERNRALTIIKSRGTEHSNQVRELILSNKGITLADVYSTGGEVLMGTLRWEKEAADRKAEEKKQAQAERKRVELELEKAEIDAKMRLLEKELEANRAELERISAYEMDRRTGEDQKLADLKRLRDAD
jgi:circadian clock protein KaiC